MLSKARNPPINSPTERYNLLQPPYKTAFQPPPSATSSYFPHSAITPPLSSTQPPVLSTLRCCRTPKPASDTQPFARYHSNNNPNHNNSPRLARSPKTRQGPLYRAISFALPNCIPCSCPNPAFPLADLPALCCVALHTTFLTHLSGSDAFVAPLHVPMYPERSSRSIFECHHPVPCSPQLLPPHCSITAPIAASFAAPADFCVSFTADLMTVVPGDSGIFHSLVM